VPSRRSYSCLQASCHNIGITMGWACNSDGRRHTWSYRIPTRKMPCWKTYEVMVVWYKVGSCEYRFWRREAGGIVSKSCLLAGFGTGDVEPPSSAIREGQTLYIRHVSIQPS
jgi:hypothetical protein